MRSRSPGAPELTPVEEIETELEQRRVQDEQVQLAEANLRREGQVLKNSILDPETVSQLTGRSRRRVVLD
jgi:hypothetical protein